MLKFSRPVMVQLRDGELMPLDGVRVAVECGRVWVTQDSDPEDHIVSDGESMQIPAGARALLSAEGPARLAVVVEPAGWADRLRIGLRWLAVRWARRLPCDLDLSLAK